MGHTHILCWVIVIYSTTQTDVVAPTRSVNNMEITASDSLIQKLFDEVSNHQVKEEVPLVPFKQFYRQKGVYSSVIKLNLHGKLDLAVARKMLSVFDNNMYVTGWVSSILLEAYQFGRSPKPTETQLMLAINAIQKYVDFNKPYNNSVLFFWPPIYNETAQYWQATAVNLDAVLKATDYIPLNLTVAILDFLGLGSLTSYLKHIIENKDVYRRIFHLCSDLDSSFNNLGFGSLLHEMRNQFPQSSTLWKKQHNNLTSIFNALKKYAYRPFHNDTRTDSIDPRTYMYLRYFLDDAKAAGKDVAVVPTWAQNLEELKTDIKKEVSMPFNVNNVDTFICANVVYGITASVLSGLVSAEVLEDPLIAQIYHNTSALIAYEMKTNMSNRPDLASMFYPSRMSLTWLMSRTLALLGAAGAKGPLPAPIMDEVYAMLQNAAKGSMTKYILSEAKQDEQGDVYYDDFLGDADLTHDNKPLQRGEDRIFTTAVAVNALLCTWTDFNETSRKSSWKKDVPPQVKQVVSGSVQWLKKHTLGGSYEPWNAFFSTSNKGNMTIINQYPANLFQDVNGTALPWSKSYNRLTDTIAVKGYIPPTEYAAMLKEKKSPLTFHGYNPPKSFFPFWSSQPFTYSVTLLALGRYGAIVN